MSSVMNEKGSAREKIFEAVLSSPGMKEKCKIGMNLSRQTILLFCRIIENGLENKEGQIADEFLLFLPGETRDELKAIIEEMLQKGGLVDFYKRLKLL
jgi:hypothetical protein